MKLPESFTQIIGQKRYSVEKATLKAAYDYWDGHNFERHGRNTFLNRTPSGVYFTVTLTQWQDERDRLIPHPNGSVDLYDNCLMEHEVKYQEAFPCVEVEDA